jgi:hypothetical protein
MRSGTEAWLPMRNLTSQEAMALLENGRARLTRIGSETVDLVTAVALVPTPTWKAADPVVRHGGRTWRPVSASWKDLSLRYRLARAPLEREAGGRPLAAFRDPKAAPARLSFASERLPLYAAFEVALLWVTLLLVWLIIGHLRPGTLIAPALLSLMAGYVWGVSWYAPALFDGDFFYQRWVVEPGAVVALAVLSVPLLWASVLSLFGLLATVILRLVRKWSPRSRAQRIGAAWAPAVLLLVVGLTSHWVTAAKERSGLDSMVGALHFEKAAAVLDDARALHRKLGDYRRLAPSELPPDLHQFVVDAFAGMPVVPSGGSHVLVPIDGPVYLFLWRSPSFLYVDFRPLGTLHNQSGIDGLLSTRRPSTTGLFAQAAELVSRATASRFNGRPVLSQQGQMLALVYIEQRIALSP